jgi:hypothetical protein
VHDAAALDLAVPKKAPWVIGVLLVVKGSHHEHLV